MDYEIECKRLRRKLAKKERKIVALEKRIRQLEAKAADATINLTRTIEKSLKYCLSNVRMIPVLGIRSSDKIIEFKVSDK